MEDGKLTKKAGDASVFCV